MAADKVVNWGIASAGLISHDFVNAIHAFKQQNLNKVIAVAARNLQSAEEFAKKFDIPKAYEGYEKLALDSEIDVVYVGSINTTHLEIVRVSFLSILSILSIFKCYLIAKMAFIPVNFLPVNFLLVDFVNC